MGRAPSWAWRPTMSLRTTPPLAMSFGLSEREMRRMAAMKTVDEPLEEEIEGLCVISAAAGALLGLPLFGSPMLGAVLGVQVGPLIAFTSGPTGENLRRAGWHSHKHWRAAIGRVRSGCAKVRLWSDRSGLTSRLVRIRARLVELDKSSGASRRLMALALSSWRFACWVASTVREWSARRGLTARLQKLWLRTGIPKFVADQRASAVLRARMRDITERGQRGF